jgi:putative DNA primase/helicase
MTNVEEKKQKQKLHDILLDTYQFRTMSDTKEIYYYDYNKGIYTDGGEIIIESQAETMDSDVTTGIVNEVMNHIRRRTYTNRNEFDSGKPEVLNLQNGLLNIDTLEFKEHSPGHLSLVQSPVKYDPKAKCPNIQKFLSEVLHPQDIFTAMQVIGYCLYKTAEYEKAVMLVGPGANGKGVFIKIIEALVGIENTSHVTLQDLDMDRFASAGLYCKMVNTFADLKSQKLSSTGIFKTLVSGDSIRAQHKFCKPFSFRNYSTLIFSANKIPETDDKSYAYYRRWLILAFEKVFEDETKDVKLIEKLTTPEELSGLLNLALIALRQLRKDNGFKDVSVEKVRKEYEEKSNTVKAFLDAKCTIDLDAPEYYTLTTDLYNEYVIFCREKREKALDMSVFGKKLAEFDIEKQKRSYYGQRDYYYIGVKLLSDLRGKNETLG